MQWAFSRKSNTEEAQILTVVCIQVAMQLEYIPKQQHMFSNNPRQDQFQLIIPKEFHDDELVAKYDKFIALKPRALSSIVDIIQESIQTVTFPPGERATLEQQMSNQPHMITRQVPAVESPLNSIKDKTLTVEFRHMEGYLNYFYMRELFNMQFLPEHQDKLFTGPFILAIVNTDHQMLYTINMKKIIFQSIAELPLGYNVTTRDFNTFACQFVYNSFEPIFELPQKSSQVN